jgi:hypothetical protein
MKQPRKATEAQIKKIKEYATNMGRIVEDIVCIASKYRTTSVNNLYSYEAAAVIKDFNQEKVK